MRFLTRTVITLVTINAALASPTSAAMETSQSKTVTISGSAGMPGVRILGLPGDPLTDQNGYYSASVPHGFTGKAQPAREGFTFEPSWREYVEVTRNIDNQDYVPSVIRFIVSGNAGIDGASMNGLPGAPVTDRAGYYSVMVDYGWSGTVTPTKEGYIFEPASRSYSRVVADQPDSNYAAKGALDPYGMGTSRSPADRRGFSSRADTRMYGSATSPAGGRSAGYGPPISSAGRKALIIPAGEIKAKELAETVEDMHVMSHILDERFKETRRIQGMFTDFGAFFGRDNRSTEAIYLQGYGLLFLMEVNFAFSPPPPKQTQAPLETTEAVDSTWQKARQEVFSPGSSSGSGDEDSGHDYDSQMVEELKKELVESLKHASNIRNIGPDEWVILTVIGGQRQSGMGFFGGGLPMGVGTSGFGAAPGAGAGGGMRGGYVGEGRGSGGGGFVVGGYGGTGGMMVSGTGGGMGGMYGGGGAMMGPGGMAAYVAENFSSSTVLTIRAKKADVDDFARGQIDVEQFQENVQIFTY